MFSDNLLAELFFLCWKKNAMFMKVFFVYYETN